MNEKVKSFYEWFFKDNIIIPNPRIDAGSKRIGKFVCFLVVGGWIVICLYIGFDVRHDPDQWEQVVYLSFPWAVGGLVGGWILYRVIRVCFRGVIWLIDGFAKPKE
jgi:hypothetical protein